MFRLMKYSDVVSVTLEALVVSDFFHRHKTGSVQQIYNNIWIAERKVTYVYINSGS